MPLQNYIWWGYSASDDHHVSVRACQLVCTCQQGLAALSSSWYIYVYYSWDDQKYVVFWWLFVLGGGRSGALLKVKKTSRVKKVVKKWQTEASGSCDCGGRAFVAFYLVYTWGTEEFGKSRRKNPSTYENDKWAIHMEDGSLSLKDPPLGDESTLYSVFKTQ